MVLHVLCAMLLSLQLHWLSTFSFFLYLAGKLCIHNRNEHRIGHGTQVILDNSQCAIHKHERIIVTTINSSRAEFILEDVEIYLHFLSLLSAKCHNCWNLSSWKTKYSKQTRPMVPCYQQPWHGIRSTRKDLSQHHGVSMLCPSRYYHMACELYPIQIQNNFKGTMGTLTYCYLVTPYSG